MGNGFLEKFSGAARGKVMIFIDAANLEQSVKSMWVNIKDVAGDLKDRTADQFHWRVDYKKFKQFFDKSCDLKNIRFYSASFGSDSHNRFLGFLKKGLEFKLTTKPLKEYDCFFEKRTYRQRATAREQLLL